MQDKVWCDECRKDTNRFPSGGCRSCVAREGWHAAQAKMTPEQRSENARKGGLRGAAVLNAKLTPEQRRENARKAGRTDAELTPQERRARRARGRKTLLAFYATLTPDQLREIKRKGGSATKGERNGQWKGEAATCRGVHSRLFRQYGPAALHSCVRCGERREVGAIGEDAMHWSYDGGAPDEKRDPKTGTRYTTDLRAGLDGQPLWYSPRCGGHCHIVYDAEHGLRGAA